MDTTGRIGEYKARKKTKGKPYLPDDIIPNILCRLPAKNASQCRLVCRRWRDLTLTRDFVDLHFSHSFPMLMVPDCCWYFRRDNHCLLDKWWELARRKLVIHTIPFHPEYEPLFSHAGLIVYRKYFSVIIFNPINLEKVTISIPRELNRSEIYGVFFHPSLKEYCSLWAIKLSNATEQYKMLNLGSSPFMKTICNPFTHIKKRYGSYPLFIDKYLYWMLEAEQKLDYKYSGRSDVMQFDIIGEEFNIKPCPVPVDTECYSDQTHLLNMDGALSFLQICPSKITIWRLENHAEQLWTAANYTFSTENFDTYVIRPLAVVDKNLALLFDRRLLVCDLMQGTMKCFRKKQYPTNLLFLPHQVSLASLRNCPSTIYLDQEGKVDVMENNLTSSSSASVSLAGSPNSNSLVIEGSDTNDDDDDDVEEEEDKVDVIENRLTSSSSASDSLAGSPSSNSLVNEGSDTNDDEEEEEDDSS